ncbi:MAG: hypothetical protein ACNA8H_13100 [Anaerolineales bacterium]
MNHQLRRIILALLVIFLLGSMAGHLFIPSTNTAHTPAESSCPIHNGMFHADKPQPLSSQPTISIEATQVCVRALQLSAKIPHPPTS